MTEPLTPTCQCGTIISTDGGRCPTCGAFWGTAASEPPSSPSRPSAYQNESAPPPSPPRIRASVGSVRPAPGQGALGSGRKPLILGLLAGGVVAGAALMMATSREDPSGAQPTVSAGGVPPSQEPEPSLSAAAADPGVLGLGDLREISPLSVLPDARRRALAWDPAAVLVSVTAHGVAQGLLDGTRGGELSLEFGVPIGGTGRGAGQPVGRDRFLVQVDENGSRVRERTGVGTAVAVGDPDCPLPSAWRKMHQSGVPKTEFPSFTYRARTGDRRAVWEASVSGKPEMSRTLDGRQCTILRN